MSTQFHPEAKGGPLDSSFLFDAYLQQVAAFKAEQCVSAPGREGRPNPLLVDILSKQRVGVAPGHVTREIERRAGVARQAAATDAGKEAVGSAL